MKVKVIYGRKTYHPKYGPLSPGQELDIDDNFPIIGSNLFGKVHKTKNKKRREVKNG